MYHGIINVYKEKGFTSFDVVAKMRGIAGQKKIGHTGTLDPDAEGVLPICLGKATRVCDLLTDSDKTYRAVLRLGVETDTLDSTGEVLKESPVTCTEEEVREAIQGFVGRIQQIPPMYSALKVNGRKLCDLAREGKTVERKARTVQIHELEIEDIALPYITFTVSCSKGTYIRTLCDDIGHRLGCGGCMDSLVRTRAGIFSMEHACRLSEIQKIKDEGALNTIIQSVDCVFQPLEKYIALEEFDILLKNGAPMPQEAFEKAFPKTETEDVRVYSSSDEFVGIYRMNYSKGALKPVKIFLI